LTAAMMVGELVVGYLTNSLALTADGWHMATHAGALGLAALAYWFARTRSHDAVFSFGTGKVHGLVGYTNAIVLAVVALWMAYEAVARLVDPLPIAFGQALPVAIVGLLVNIASMLLLHVDAGDHHEHEHRDGDVHHDHNLRAAYVHVLADAFTSVLAILALFGGRYLGWRFLDPLMGMVGSAVILRWSYQLSRGAARQLLDVVPSDALATRIREDLERVPGTEVIDLHVWEIGPNAIACLASVIATDRRTPLEYAERLREERLAHVTIEVHQRDSVSRDGMSNARA
jgi:cation diffusion facilitator family transporter